MALKLPPVTQRPLQRSNAVQGTPPRAAPATQGPAAQPPGWARAGFGQDGMLAVKTSAPAGAATGNGGAKLPPDLAKFFNGGQNVPQMKAEFAAIQASINKGDYQAAAQQLEAVRRKKEEHFSEAKMGSDPVAQTRGALAQLDFLAKMQAAGVKADYPPTQGQLQEYFGKLKGQPAEARQALEDYFRAFHQHPGVGKDVTYGTPETTSRRGTDVTTTVPSSWDQTAGRPSSSGGEHVGKQLNDCEGFAFMAQSLLGAAGFKLAHHLTAHGTPVGEHAMAAFSHPKEKGVTVTSNDGVFQGRSEKAAVKEAYAYALGEGGTPTGQEGFYTGATMKDSQVSAMSGGPKL